MKINKELSENEIRQALITDTVAIHFRKMIANTRIALGNSYAAKVEIKYENYIIDRYGKPYRS